MYNDYTTISTSATNVAAIKQSIKNILLTPRGSLPGKPNFGSDIYELLFSQMDGLTESLAKNFVNEALREFEDRIRVDEVIVSRDEALNKLIIKVRFTYYASNKDLSQDSTAVAFAV